MTVLPHRYGQASALGPGCAHRPRIRTRRSHADFAQSVRRGSFRLFVSLFDRGEGWRVGGFRGLGWVALGWGWVGGCRGGFCFGGAGGLGGRRPKPPCCGPPTWCPSPPGLQVGFSRPPKSHLPGYAPKRVWVGEGGREGGIADTTVVMTTAAPRCVLLHHGLKTASHFPPELCEIKTGVQVAGGPIPPDPTSPLRWGVCRVD